MKRLSGPLRGAGVGIVLLVLVFMPYFKGLFFWTELLPAIALVALAFALWIVGRRLGDLSVGVPGGVAGGALLALAGCYALQFVWAVYPRGNLDWLLRVLAGWLVFVMFRAEASERLRRVMAWALVVGASAVAVHGLVEFTGLRVMNAELLERLSFVGLSSRMYAAFEYPNTASVYFLSTLFVAVGLGVKSGRAWVMGLVSGLGSLLAVAFFFTVSRGAVLMVPFGLVLLFLGIERRYWWSALLLFGAVALPTLLFVGPIGNAVGTKVPMTALSWVGVALSASLMIGTLTGLLARLPFRRQLALVAVLAVLGTAGGALVMAKRPFLPTQATRLLDMNWRTQNVVIRMVYYRDAARIVADHPLGRGGWGWARSYKQYATFNHTARETHNHFAQTAVEAGLPGLLALVASLVAGLWGAWHSRKGNPLGWALASGAALIAGHSLIDFDLSFGGIWLLLWSLLGAGISEVPQGKQERVLSASALASALAILVTAVSLGQGARLNEEAAELAEAGKRSEAEAAAAKAAKWDPLSSDALVNAGDHAKLLRAVQVDPSSSEAWFKLSISHELRKEYQPGLEAARRAADLDPWVSTYVDKGARIAGLLMLDELGAGRYDEALTLAQVLNDLERDWTERLAASQAEQYLWGVKPGKLDPSTLLRFAQARFLMGDLIGAKQPLLDTAKVGLLNSEAEVWLYALYEREGDAAGMKRLQNQPWIRFREANPVYKAIHK